MPESGWPATSEFESMTTKMGNSENSTGTLSAEVLEGLRSHPKFIAPKYFYDKRGAALFDAITELDEYYVMRTEAEIFRQNRAEICESVGRGAHVVEPGAGSCEKIRWLLPDLEPAGYQPMDISAEHLKESANKLKKEYPGLNVIPEVCDHTTGLEIEPPAEPILFFYPGSSIGNFEPRDAVTFMESMRSPMGRSGGLLIGVDAKKDEAVLRDAYNDREGVTAEFNLNVLTHLNQRFGGTLDARHFEHVARYDESKGRIEMYLRCKQAHSAELADESVEFESDELIHTENSYKYHPEEFVELARKAGLESAAIWQDERAWFSLIHLVPS